MTTAYNNWNRGDTWVSPPSTADRIEKWMKSMLAINRAMETTLIDVVAAYTPWLASLVPAFLGYENVRRALHFEIWQALVYAAVVEALGLATVATTLQLWNWNQENKDRRAPFALAMLTAVFYLVIVLLVNVLLDDGNAVQKGVKALASSLAVVGALTVALRSQQSKLVQEAKSLALEAEVERKAEKQRQDENQHLHLETLRLEKQKELELARLQAEDARKEREAERNLRKELKLAEMQLKLTNPVAESSESGRKVAESGGKFPETFGKWSDWRQLPYEHKTRIASMTARQVHEEYGVPDKTSGNWVRKAVAL